MLMYKEYDIKALLVSAWDGFPARCMDAYNFASGKLQLIDTDKIQADNSVDEYRRTSCHVHLRGGSVHSTFQHSQHR